MLLVVITFSFLPALPMLAQEIRLVKTFGGVRFEDDSSAYSPRQVLELMRDVPLAYAEFKKAKTSYGIAGVLGAAGSFLVAFPVVTALAGGEPEWALAAAGGVLVLTSIPISKSFRVRAQNALDMYNGRVHREASVQAHFTGTGLAVVIRF